MYIYIVNESTVLTDTQVQAAVPAFAAFAKDVRSWWNIALGTFIVTKTPPANSWQLVILDDSDQAGALGYHDYAPGGKPISKIFAKTDLDNGYSWTVTFTHELCEMLGDPYISATMQTGNSTFAALELGDPVEADADGYYKTTPSGLKVLCSDFVTPAWFIPGHPGPVFDMVKHCKKPGEIRPGGYAYNWTPSGGWAGQKADGSPADADDAPRSVSRWKIRAERP